MKVSVKSLRVVTVKYRLDYNACLLFLVNTAILDQRLSARIDSLKTAGIGTKERINIIKISQSFQNSLGFRRSLYLLTSRFNQEIISKSHPRALLKKKKKSVYLPVGCLPYLLPMIRKRDLSQFTAVVSRVRECVNSLAER